MTSIQAGVHLTVSPPAKYMILNSLVVNRGPTAMNVKKRQEAEDEHQASSETMPLPQNARV